MTWLSINPDSEPVSSVEVVADEFSMLPNQVNGEAMADYYNVIDPTLAELEVTPEAKARFVDRWLTLHRDDEA